MGCQQSIVAESHIVVRQSNLSEEVFAAEAKGQDAEWADVQALLGVEPCPPGPPPVQSSPAPVQKLVRRHADETILDSVGTRMLPWHPDRFSYERKLEDATRNDGVVDLMRDAEAGGGFVAVKRMPLRWTQKDAASFEKKHAGASERPWYDIAIVNFLNGEGCAFACKLHGVFGDDSCLYVATSLATGGDLFDWSGKVAEKPGAAREAAVRPVARQLASAVRALHDLGICHRDISLENVLVHHEAGSLRVKLIDFGMAAFERSHSDPRGKYSYQAPEMHRGSGAYDGFLADAFAVGVVLFCMAVKDYPWLSTNRGSCRNFDFAAKHGITKWLSTRKLAGSDRTPLAEVLSCSLAQLLQGLLDFEPSARLTLGERAWQSQHSDHAIEMRKSVWGCWLGPEEKESSHVHTKLTSTENESQASTEGGTASATLFSYSSSGDFSDC